MTNDSMSYSTLLMFLKSIRPNGLIDRCLCIYCRESWETLARRLLRYKDYFGEEDKELVKLAQRREVTKQAKLVAVELIENKLSEDEKRSFRQVLQIVNTLMYFNGCEDLIRHATLDGLSDYFLRENVAKALFELGIISTREPADYPQRFLLCEAEKVLDSAGFAIKD